MERLVEGVCAIKHIAHIRHVGHVPLCCNCHSSIHRYNASGGISCNEIKTVVFSGGGLRGGPMLAGAMLRLHEKFKNFDFYSPDGKSQNRNDCLDFFFLSRG